MSPAWHHGWVTPVDVHDPDDPRLADFCDLTDADLRRAAEAGGGFFVAEGPQTVARVAASPHPLRSVLVTPTRWERMKEELGGVDVPVYRAPQPVLDRVVGFHLHRGVVATAGRLPEPDPRSLLGSRRLVVLEGINDQENLGAIFRSALALGADGVLLDPTCADPYYRRTVRVSMGAVAMLPFARLPVWPGDLSRMRDGGRLVVALSPAGRMAIDQVDPGDRPVAAMLGAEGPGLSKGAMAAASVVARIPMAGPMDSLNVGHAAAVAFHRLFAARRFRPSSADGR